MKENLEKTNQTKGTIYIVSTPIGNKKDITLRATEVLQNCDIVVGEEIKEASRVLIHLNLSKPIELLNEHNEKEKVWELIDLVKSGKSIALISDCGTPIFADPGIELVRAALANGLDIKVVPGASSIMTAIVRSGFDLKRFFYVGFLNRNSKDRIKEIQDLSNFPYTLVVMDTPYRLKILLEDFAQVMPHRRAYIGMNLTMQSETHHYGTFLELYEKFKSIRIRNEYVIVIEGYALGKLSSVSATISDTNNDNFIDDSEGKKISKYKLNKQSKRVHKKDRKSNQFFSTDNKKENNKDYRKNKYNEYENSSRNRNLNEKCFDRKKRSSYNFKSFKKGKNN